ncbi:MAG: DUF6044 family protein [Bacteroidota bacterium]
MKFNNPYLIFLLGGVIFFIPLLIFGEGLPLPISDHLDSNHVWYKILKDQNAFFLNPWEKIEGYLGSQYRFTYPSPLRLIALLYFIFPVLPALIMLKVLIYCAAFFSFYLFLEHNNLGKPDQRALWALLWAILSFYPFAELGIAALPLLYFAIIHLRKGKMRRAMLILSLYIFASDSIIVTIPIISFLALFQFFISSLNWKKLHIPLVFFIICPVLVLIKEYQLIYGLVFQSDFVSHRVEFFSDGYVGQYYFYAGSLWMLGQLTGVHYLFLIPSLVLIFFVMGVKKAWDLKFATLFLFISLLISLIAAALTFPPWINGLAEISPALGSFNWSRVYHLIPFFILLALLELWRNWRGQKAFYSLIFLIFLQVGLGNYEWRSLIKRSIGLEGFSYNPSYKEFYSSASFEKIKNKIPRSYQGNVVHIGIPPAVSAFNGLKTRDGYLPFYDLGDKNAIRKIIEKELIKEESFQRNFDFWGNKAYLIQSHHPEWVLPFKKPNASAILKLPPLDFHWELFPQKENTHYLISAFPLSDPELTLLTKIDDPESAWLLFLYKIKG